MRYGVSSQTTKAAAAFLQYNQDLEELQELQKRIDFLRLRIKRFEEAHT